MNNLLTTKPVTEILDLKYPKTLELIKLGKLNAIKIDKSFKITENDLHNFI